MKKILSLLLAGLTCIAPLSIVGCNSDGDKTAAQESKVVLADFEEWSNFSTLALYGRFGRITRNADENYVRNGIYSAKLQPVGGRLNTTQPYFVMPVKSEKFNYNYSDFTYYEEVSAYLYNASDEAIVMTFGLAASYNASTASKLVGENIVLAPKTWTRASYLVDWDFLSIASDPTSISGIYFQFPDSGVEYPDDAPTIYLDDVVLTKAKTQGSASGNLDLDKTDTKTEICDFEKIWQKYAYTTSVTEDCGTVSVVSAEDYGITASSGEKILRVVRNNSGAGGFNVGIPGQLFKAAGMHEVPEEEWASTYFCFDMWNNSSKYAEYHSIWAYKEGGNNQNPKQWRENSEGEYEWVGYWTWPRPTYGRWTTYKISLWELSQGFGDKAYVVMPDGFQMTFADYGHGEEWEMFLDNFRLEKGEKLKGVK